MTKKISVESIEVEGFYFPSHPGLVWHSGKFWAGEKEVKKVANNGSISLLLHGSKIGLKKLRARAQKCKIKINDLPF